MAYVWIQPWYYALPVILEEPVMGDGAQNRGRAPLDHSAQNYPLREEILPILANTLLLT